MPGSEVVVADTSPLLNAALVDRLDVVRSQFDSIIVPEAVRSELLAGEEGSDDLRTLLAGPFVTVVAVERDDLVRELRSELDVGESAAIALAVERNADLVLIDERDGRQVARRHGLSVTGIIGLLLRGARDGDVSIEPAVDDLRDAGFWIGDDLYRRAIDEIETDESR